MTNLSNNLFPLWAALLSWAVAQVIKPFLHYASHKQWQWDLIWGSGGMPSSHSSSVSALCLAVGLLDNFDSPLFAVTLFFAFIVCYDAANVRYYAGENISLTKKLIDDLKELSMLEFDDPIYEKKLKLVLGHTYFEVIFGIVLGLSLTFILYAIMF